MRNLLIVLHLFLLVPHTSQAQDECVELARTFAYDRFRERIDLSDRRAFRHAFCEAVKNKSDVGVAIGIPGYFTLGFDEAKDLQRLLCEDSYARTQLELERDVLVDRVSPLAAQVIDNCLATAGTGLRTKTTISDMLLSLDLSYTPPAGSSGRDIGVTHAKWDSENLECFGWLAEVKAAEAKLENKARNLTCSRKNVRETPVVVGDRAIFHKGGWVSVPTEAGTVHRILPPITAPAPALLEMVRSLEQRLEGTAVSLKCEKEASPKKCKGEVTGLQGPHSDDIYCCKVVLAVPEQ